MRASWLCLLVVPGRLAYGEKRLSDGRAKLGRRVNESLNEGIVKREQFACDVSGGISSWNLRKLGAEGAVLADKLLHFMMQALS